MQVTLSALLAKASAEFVGLQSRADFEAAKARYVGPNGELTALMKQMGAVPKEQRPALGKLINEAKGQLQGQLDAALARISSAEIAAQLGPSIDPTLPSPDAGPGTSHPLTLVREEMCRILRKAGFAVVEGPEVETEYYCFDALSTPADHPARDAQDTFYSLRKRGLAISAKRSQKKNICCERILLRCKFAPCLKVSRPCAWCHQGASIVEILLMPPTVRIFIKSNVSMLIKT